MALISTLTSLLPGSTVDKETESDGREDSGRGEGALHERTLHFAKSKESGQATHSYVEPQRARMSAGSLQVTWLRRDRDTHQLECT